MKQAQKLEKMRAMSDAEMKEEIERLDKELMHLRMGNAIGTAENPLNIRFLRRDVARLKTLLHERALKTRDAK